MTTTYSIKPFSEFRYSNIRSFLSSMLAPASNERVVISAGSIAVESDKKSIFTGCFSIGNARELQSFFLKDLCGGKYMLANGNDITGLIKCHYENTDWIDKEVSRVIEKAVEKLKKKLERAPKYGNERLSCRIEQELELLK